MRKVNSVLREVLADEIERLTDPRGDGLRPRRDQPGSATAIVYISTLTRAGEEAVAAQLPLPSPGAVAPGTMKHTPHLEFALDTGVVHGDRIDSILRRIATEDPTPEEE